MILFYFGPDISISENDHKPTDFEIIVQIVSELVISLRESKSEMDQDKLSNLQNQLKHNTDELHEFLRDLDSWEADIKTKDRKLKEDKAPDRSDCDVN